jgi:thioredoxin reductase (NADPH)
LIELCLWLQVNTQMRRRTSAVEESDMQRRIKLFGEVKSPEAYRIRDFLQRNGVRFQWIEVSCNDDAKSYVGLASPSDPRFPVLTVGDHPLYAPSLAQIVQAIGGAVTPADKEYDLAVYGAGPAGLSAAVYGASEGLHTILVERYSIGGQAAGTSRIENYLGFSEGIGGAELARRAREQALRFGAEILLATECVAGGVDQGTLVGVLDSGAIVRSRSVICATGVEYVRLNLPNEERLLGRGFYYGTGSSEVKLCGGHVFIVGGGNSAGQAALHLASRVSKVTMLVRGQSLKETLSQYLIDRIRLSPNIEVKVLSVLTAIEGEQALERIRYRDLESGEETEVDTGWLFVCVGGRPQTEWTDVDRLARDSAGYILTGMDLLQNNGQQRQWSLERGPYPMETSIPGVFAAGDIRSNSIKRCATAVGEGAAAVASVHRYLSSISEMQGVPERR